MERPQAGQSLSCQRGCGSLYEWIQAESPWTEHWNDHQDCSVRIKCVQYMNFSLSLSLPAYLKMHVYMCLHNDTNILTHQSSNQFCLTMTLPLCMIIIYSNISTVNNNTLNTLCYHTEVPWALVMIWPHWASSLLTPCSAPPSHQVACSPHRGDSEAEPQSFACRGCSVHIMHHNKGLIQLLDLQVGEIVRTPQYLSITLEEV